MVTAAISIIIRVSVSFGFIFSRLTMVRQLGFVKALSVPLDAFVQGLTRPVH